MCAAHFAQPPDPWPAQSWLSQTGPGAEMQPSASMAPFVGSNVPTPRRPLGALTGCVAVCRHRLGSRGGEGGGYGDPIPTPWVAGGGEVASHIHKWKPPSARIYIWGSAGGGGAGSRTFGAHFCFRAPQRGLAVSFFLTGYTQPKPKIGKQKSLTPKIIGHLELDRKFHPSRGPFMGS